MLGFGKGLLVLLPKCGAVPAARHSRTLGTSMGPRPRLQCPGFVDSTLASHWGLLGLEAGVRAGTLIMP